MTQTFEIFSANCRHDNFGWPIMSEVIPTGHGKNHRAKWQAAKRPATVHHETRQQRRAKERRAKKGGDA